MHLESDVLIIGAGAAGIYAALEANRAGASVILVDRSLIGRSGATVMAQMTVAAALGEREPDDPSFHLSDTLAAGRGLCDEALSAMVCEEGPGRIRQTDEWKVGWARDGEHIAQVHAHPVTKDLQVLKNESAIRRSVRNIVQTIPTERFFNPLFGSDVTGSLFDFVDFGTASVIQSQIEVSISNFEPRVDNVRVEVYPRPDNNEFEVNVIFDIIGQEFPTQEYTFLLEATR